MTRCEFEFPKDMTVEVFNVERRKHHNLMKLIASGEVRLRCDSCAHPMMDQDHTDFTMYPPMRQMVCSNQNCRKAAYRYE